MICFCGLRWQFAFSNLGLLGANFWQASIALSFFEVFFGYNSVFLSILDFA